MSKLLWRPGAPCGVTLLPHVTMDPECSALIINN
jgi:hypothetical protein